MKTKRSTDDDQSTSGGDEDYRSKRDRNNQAVKRSRVKAKQKTHETEERVRELKLKNQLLDENIKKHEKELKFLKDLFLAQAQSKSDQLTGIDIKALLEESADEDDTRQSSRTN